MRVAFIHNCFPAGGAERVTIDIARSLSGYDGYEFFVYTTRVSQDLLDDSLPRILTVRLIPSQAIPSARCEAIERFIISDEIDILVSVTKSFPGIDGIRYRTGCKVVVACHGEPFWQRHAIVHRRQKGIFNRICWTLFNRRRFADGKLAMSMAVKRTMNDYLNCDAYTVLCESYKTETAELLGLNPSDSHIHAIENPEYIVDDPCLEKEKVILFCGRLENWSKRIDRLLRVWKKIQDSLPDWRLVIVGDGPDREMLRSMASDLDLSRVSFEGQKSDVSSYYRSASIVALTSETEGWPLVLTEAQANGCIAVSFGCTSGIMEILAPECGYVVPPYDEELFAEEVIRIAGLSDEDALKVRLNAIRRRAEYTPEIISQKWKLLFDSLIK